MLRRNAPAGEQPTVEFGDVRVDLAATRVTVRGEEVRLTPTEWRLLELLVRHPGKLISQRQILDQVWGPGYESAQGNLRLYIAQLRRKLEAEPSRPQHLRTEPGPVRFVIIGFAVTFLTVFVVLPLVVFKLDRKSVV